MPSDASARVQTPVALYNRAKVWGKVSEKGKHLPFNYRDLHKLNYVQFQIRCKIIFTTNLNVPENPPLYCVTISAPLLSYCTELSAAFN